MVEEATPTDEGRTFFDAVATPVVSPVATVIDGKATPRVAEDYELPADDELGEEDGYQQAEGQPPFELKCMICHERTSNPIMFPCLDISCTTCLEKQFEQQQQHRNGLRLLRDRQYNHIEQDGDGDPQGDDGEPPQYDNDLLLDGGRQLESEDRPQPDTTIGNSTVAASIISSRPQPLNHDPQNSDEPAAIKASPHHSGSSVVEVPSPERVTSPSGISSPSTVSSRSTTSPLPPPDSFADNDFDSADSSDESPLPPRDSFANNDFDSADSSDEDDDDIDDEHRPLLPAAQADHQVHVDDGHEQPAPTPPDQLPRRPGQHDGSDEAVICDWFCCPLCQYKTEISLDENKEKIRNLLMDMISVPLRNIDHFASLREDLPQGKINCGYATPKRVNCCNVATYVCCGVCCNYLPLCDECLQDHLQQAAARAGFEEHKVVNVNSWDWIDLKRMNETCKVRGLGFDRVHNLPKTQYCEDHDEVICLLCTVLGSIHHNQNHYCVVKDCEGPVHEEAKQVTERNLHALQRIRDRVTAAMTATNDLKQTLKNKLEEKKNLIWQKYADIKQKLDAQRDSLLNNCDILYKYKSNELQSHHFKLREVYEPLNRCIEFVKWFKDEAIASEFMMLKTQINQRLEELNNTHRRDEYKPYEDDRIYFKESEFDIPNEAIGHVYSTPSVEKFNLLKPNTSNIYSNIPLTISVIPRDAIQNDVSMYPDIHQPQLLVSIKHMDSGESHHGCVVKDPKTGKSFMTVRPYKNGKHELRVYRPMKPPYNDHYIETKRSFEVHDSDFPTAIARKLLLAVEMIGKAIIDPEP